MSSNFKKELSKRAKSPSDPTTITGDNVVLPPDSEDVILVTKTTGISGTCSRP